MPDAFYISYLMLLHGVRGVFFMPKILLEAENLRKSIGQRLVIDADHLTVADGDRIGLIGENGAGKTTLLCLLSGETEADEGTIRRLGTFAFIHQQGNEEGETDEQMRALFRAREQREGLSGGEMTRNRIAAALSARPQMLMADEPTTDLDEEGLENLRKQLGSFSGALILISHDRSLLRLLCRQIWYLEDGKINAFPGGYENQCSGWRKGRAASKRRRPAWGTVKQGCISANGRTLSCRSAMRNAPSRTGWSRWK